eukprot:UN01100
MSRAFTFGNTGCERQTEDVCDYGDTGGDGNGIDDDDISDLDDTVTKLHGQQPQQQHPTPQRKAIFDIAALYHQYQHTVGDAEISSISEH